MVSRRDESLLLRERYLYDLRRFVCLGTFGLVGIPKRAGKRVVSRRLYEEKYRRSLKAQVQ